MTATSDSYPQPRITMPPRRIAPLLQLLLAFSLVPALHGQAEPVSRFVNPPSLSKPSGYTHVVVAADGRTVYVAGQIALDSTGKLIGAGDFRAQAVAVYENLQRALASVGGSLSDLVKTTTYITDVGQVPVLREVRSRFLDATHPPANTLVPLAALARSDLLIEIEGVAVLRAPYRP